MTKIRQDNNVSDLIGVVYAKNEIELLLSIRPGVVYNENKIE